MAEYNNLQKALIKTMEEEVRTWKEAAKAKPHKFSRNFEFRMQKLISGQKTSLQQATGAEKYKSVRVRVFGHMIRRSVAVLLAALLILATTIAAIAIVKPEIFYVIIKKTTNWEITPKSKNEEGVQTELNAIRIEAFNGYTLISEEHDEVRYNRVFEDKEGNNLSYTQYLPEGTSISLDSEGISTEKAIIKGLDVVITRHDENSVTIVVEDGEYIFVISGDCYNDALELAEHICNR